MEIKVLENSKNEAELEIESLTIVEILKTYLNEDSDVLFAAWKKEHPTKKPILKVKTKTKTAKKAINDAISKITKDLDNLQKDFSKLD